MSQVTTKASSTPADTDVADPEVIAFRSQFDGRSSLDEIVRQGAQQMLQRAIENEVDEFLVQKIVRLKKTWIDEYDQWCRRDLTGNRCQNDGRRAVTANRSAQKQVRPAAVSGQIFWRG